MTPLSVPARFPGIRKFVNTKARMSAIKELFRSDDTFSPLSVGVYSVL